MDQRSRKWRGFARRSIALANRIETTYAAYNTPRPNDALSIVTFATLVYAKRLATAIHTLTPGSAYESQILLRTLLELWANLRWIHIRDSKRRANRFCNYYPVEQMKLLQKVPKEARPDGYEKDLRYWGTARAAKKHLFYHSTERNGVRKLRWDETWARDGDRERKSAYDRLIDIKKDELAEARGRANTDSQKVGSPEKPEFYFLYSQLSRYVHAAPGSLERLLTISPRGVRAETDPLADPSLPLRFATACLLEVMRMAVGTLSMPYDDEVSELFLQHLKLQEPSQ